MMVLGFPVAVLGFPLAAPIVGFITSAEYVVFTTTVLQLFFVAVALGFVTGPVALALTAAGRERPLALLSLGMLLLNVGVAAVLVPFLDAAGAGVGLVVSETVGAVAAVRLLWSQGMRPIRFRFVLHLALINGGCALLAMALTDLHVVVQATVLVGAYGSLTLTLPVVRQAARAAFARTAPGGRMERE